MVSKIVEAASGCVGFLEIGPGPAVLTEPLAELGSVIAIEADPRMVMIAREAVPSARVIHEDALRLDWSPLLLELPAPRAIVSNMPYNITGPLLDRICGVRRLTSMAVLMMQKEVGEKVLAQPGDSARGALSVVIQRLFEVTRVCVAPAGAFVPPPKVDSVVLRLVPRLELLDEDDLSRFVRRGFTQPRKKLSNNLGELGWVVTACGLDPNIRPHQVMQDDWVRLFDARLRPDQG